MIIKKNKIIFTDYVNKNNLKFNYIDVGARGDISSPWSELENNSLIIGFEPDSNEAKRLNKTFLNRRYFDIALWSEKITKKVFINEWESTSSMYESNEKLISNFHPRHWQGRKTKFATDVNCDTLDSILSEAKIVPDFIKIDTQGAELEILKGGEKLLKQYSPIVTCETWCVEVYKNAPMMHEVIEYMHSIGYQVFDMEIAAAWKHGINEIYSKQKSIGYEILFVKNLESLTVENEDRFIKFLLLLELYGYRDYALYLLDKKDIKHKAYLVDKLNRNSINDFRFLTRILNKIKKLLLGKLIFPNIKY